MNSPFFAVIIIYFFRIINCGLARRVCLGDFGTRLLRFVNAHPWVSLRFSPCLALVWKCSVSRGAGRAAAAGPLALPAGCTATALLPHHQQQQPCHWQKRLRATGTGCGNFQQTSTGEEPLCSLGRHRCLLLALTACWW